MVPYGNNKCEECDCMIQKNTRHCEICNRCTYEFDHHCSYLNNCVGENNYREFFVSLFFILIHVTFSLVIIVIYFFQVLSQDSSKQYQMWLTLLDFCLTAPILIKVGYTFGWHVFYRIKGIKSVTYMEFIAQDAV